LLLSFNYCVGQKKTPSYEQSKRLNAKNGFRKYNFGMNVALFQQQATKKIENSVSSDLKLQLIHENLTISEKIKAKEINYYFNKNKLESVSLEIEYGSEKLLYFLIEEYGSPTDTLNLSSELHSYKWIGAKCMIYMLYNSKRQNCILNFWKATFKDEKTQIRNSL
jgi:hypothetical protein